MAWTYTGDPSNNDLDRCRFLIGDIDIDNPVMQDSEVNYLIDTYGANPDKLYYHLFISAATIFARDIKRSLGPQSEDPTSRLLFFKQQAEHYKAISINAGLSLPKYAYPKAFRKGGKSNPPWPLGGV